MKIITLTHIEINTIWGLQNFYKNLNNEFEKNNEIISVEPFEKKDNFFKIWWMFFYKPWKIFSLKKHNPDIILIHWPAFHEIYLVILLKIFFRKKRILCIHHGILSLDKTKTRVFSFVFYRFFARFYHKLFFVWKTSFELINKWYNWNNESIISAAHNFLEIQKPDGSIKNQIVFIGRLDESGIHHKNPGLIIETVAKMKNPLKIVFISPENPYNFQKLSDLARKKM